MSKRIINDLSKHLVQNREHYRPIQSNDLLRVYDLVSLFKEDIITDICRIDNTEYLILIDLSGSKMVEGILNQASVPCFHDGKSNEYYVYIKYNNIPV